ncbi:MAG: glycosyltransferase family 2 protein [Caldilineaceae bacterium]|nr:glycosyltransferase family 2 protein [Caldilineaceae bacterium]
MSAPRVTIGLPVYNGEKYLATAIESILTQTYRDFELIIADNASTDGTAAICRAYTAKDDRVRYVRNAQNLGAAPNFNLTLALARGEYFKWAAYDDWIGPAYLEHCVAALDAHPDVVLCQTATQAVNAAGVPDTVLRYHPGVYSTRPEQRFRSIAMIRDNTAVPVFGLIRTDILRRTSCIGSYPSSDVVLLAELSLYGPFLELDVPLFFWRVHPQQSTRGVYAVERDRVAWFDTAAAARVTLPKWQFFHGYIRAVMRAPLGWGQRLYCYAHIGRWVFMRDHYRAMVKDLLLAARGRASARSDISPP